MGEMFKNEAKKFLISGNLEKAITNLELWMKNTKNIDVDYVINLGFLYLKIKNNELAKKTFKEVIEMDYTNHQAHYGLGAIAEEADELEDALFHYSNSLKCDPLNYTTLYNIAGIYSDLGDLKNSKRYYDMSIKVNPKNIWGYMGIARLCDIKKDYSKGKKYLLKALKVNPNNGKVQYNLGENACCRGKIDEAVCWYNKSIDADWSYELAYISLSVIYMDQNKLEESYDVLIRGIEKYPKVSTMYYNLSCVSFILGKKDIALENILKAISISKGLLNSALDDDDFDDSFKNEIRKNIS